MTNARHAPAPRPALLNPQLTRPDWTSVATRDPALLWLDKNENADPILIDLVAHVVSDVARQAVAVYPESGRVYAKLAAMDGVDPRQLVLAAGSDGVIRSVFDAFVSAGDLVVHTSPTFAMYPVYSMMHGARVVTIEYQPGHEHPILPFESLVAAIRNGRPRLVCLPNPDSPTGTVLSSGEIQEIADTAAAVGAMVLIDEAYYPFYDVTAAHLIARFPNIIVARTFAKAWGMAGLRVGYAIASVETALALHKVRPMYEVNTLAVAVVDRMLDYCEEVTASVSRLIEGRDSFGRELRTRGFRTLQSHGNFIHVHFGDQADQIHYELAKVVLYRRTASDLCLRGFSRFSATTKERFEPVIAAIVAGLKHA